MKDNIKVIGKVDFEKFLNGRKIYHKKYVNTIMNDALDELLKSFYDTNNSNMLFKNIAFGDDDTPNTNDMLLLNNEFFRITILSKRRTDVGDIVVRAVMTDLQPEYIGGACDIKEIGLFASSHSYDFNILAVGYHMNTGLLVSRIVVNETKNVFEQVQITWTISLVRG